MVNNLIFFFIYLFSYLMIHFFITWVYLRFYQKIKPFEKNVKFPKQTNKNILFQLFFLFPYMIVKDFVLKNPYEFQEHGLHLICGEQGSGKTITVCYLLEKMKNRYPMLKIRTNMAYKYEDASVYHYKQLCHNDNGIYGQIEVIDEIQTWFSTKDSLNFDVDMLGEISQQRKQRKMLLGTSQVFHRVSKQIREQTFIVYMPMTFFGCLTIVRKTKPHFYCDEKMKFKKYIGFFVFVHTDKLRDSYDTYKKIERYKKIGGQINQNKD